MLTYEQRLTEAAMQYLAQLESATPILNIHAWSATCDADLQAELPPFLEEILAMGQPIEPIVLTSEEQAIADRVASSSRQRVANRLM